MLPGSTIKNKETFAVKQEMLVIEHETIVIYATIILFTTLTSRGRASISSENRTNQLS